MSTETCFLCGAPGPLRRVEVVVQRAHATGLHAHHAEVTELRPLCAACIERRDAQAKAVLKVAGGTLAVIGGMTGLAFLVPLFLCLGSSAAVAVYFWLHR